MSSSLSIQSNEIERNDKEEKYSDLEKKDRRNTKEWIQKNQISQFMRQFFSHIVFINFQSCDYKRERKVIACFKFASTFEAEGDETRRRNVKFFTARRGATGAKTRVRGAQSSNVPMMIEISYEKFFYMERVSTRLINTRRNTRGLGH